MCGRCDMGRKSFFCRTHFFSSPPPLGGVTTEKKYPTRYQKFFSSPPRGGALMEHGLYRHQAHMCAAHFSFLPF